MKRAILGWILPLELFFGLLDAFNFPRYDVSNEHLLGGGVEAPSPPVHCIRLLAWGDNTKGQLGVGHLQESHEPW